MFYDQEKIKEWEKQKPRNASGRFVKKDTPPQEASETSVETETPDFTVPDPTIEKPLVSFSVNNPFKKVLYWLNDIRKKQTTTFDFKIKIPLMALPVFIIVLAGAFQTFFNLGKDAQKQAALITPTPSPVVVAAPTKPPEPVILSRIGTVKATYQVKDLLSPTPQASTDSASVTPLPTKTPSRYVLELKGDQIIFLVGSPDFSFDYYLGERVLATGVYDKTANILKISKASDLEILP